MILLSLTTPFTESCTVCNHDNGNGRVMYAVTRYMHVMVRCKNKRNANAVLIATQRMIYLITHILRVERSSKKHV